MLTLLRLATAIHRIVDRGDRADPFPSDVEVAANPDLSAWRVACGAIDTAPFFIRLGAYVRTATPAHAQNRQAALGTRALTCVRGAALTSWIQYVPRLVLFSQILIHATASASRMRSSRGVLGQAFTFAYWNAIHGLSYPLAARTVRAHPCLRAWAPDLHT